MLKTKIVGYLIYLLLGSGALWSSEIREVRVPLPSPLDREVCFYYRMPAKTQKKPLAATNVLFLVPGFNGDGRMFLRQEAWTRFADENGMILVSPSFQTNLEEIHSHKGYYYPELWSGQATVTALEQIAAKEQIKLDKILLFGFSAGAHFTHRFALWKPEMVKAFVAYSAGWWDEPTAALREVPALILCGEEDERYEPTLAFMRRGLELNLPWVWRSYKGTGHVITPAVVRMAQAFLAHYASGEKAENFAGDTQSYEYFDEKSEKAQKITAESRVTLPSKAVAERWKMESEP